MDDVLRLADEIIDGCEDLIESFERSVDVSRQALAVALDLGRDLESSTSILNAPRARLALISQGLMSMTQDIQIQLLPNRLVRLLRTLAFPPLRLIVDDFEVQANQAAPIRLEWDMSAAYPALLLTIPLNLRLATQPGERVDLLLPIAIVVIAGTADLGFLLAGEPRFGRTASGGATDPLRTVPARRRGEAREQLRQSVRDALKVQRLSLRNFGLSQLGLNVRPIGHATRRSLLIAAATDRVRHRRAGFPDDLGVATLDQSITLRDTIISEKVGKELRRYKASLTKFTLKRGRIEIEARRRENRTECHIEVEVKVNIGYNIYIQEDMPADIFGSAYWTYWSYDIEARRCWPVCSRVLRQAKQEVVREIEKVKFLTFGFADLSSVATRAVVRIRPSDLTILMKGQ